MERLRCRRAYGGSTRSNSHAAPKRDSASQEQFAEGSTPIAPAAADRDGNESQDQIDRHDRADLAELPAALGPVLPRHRSPEAAPRRKIEVKKQQHHQDADPHHQLDVERDPAESA